MGLSNETREQKTYVSVINSTFTIRAKAGEEGAVERTTKTGKQVWEKHYPRLEGQIIHISKHTHEWEGKKIVSWEIDMTDVLNEFILKLNYSSREAKALLSRLPNIDLEQPVTLSVGTFTDKRGTGKEIPYLTAYQNGSKVEPFYTKENLPPMKEIKVKGVVTWDDSEQLEVFEEMIAKRFPKISVDVDIVDDPETVPPPDDGLPF